MEITAETPLPQLREELVFLESGSDGDGRDGVLIFDPVRHKYFRIGVAAARAFALWTVGSAGRLIERLNQQGESIEFSDISVLVKFAIANCLCVAGAGGTERFVDQNEKAKKSLFTRGLHGYLFFKIPLVRPQRYLNAAFPYVRWLGSRASIRTIVIITLIGMYLSARQFDVFWRTFSDFANWQGAVLLGLTLILLKVAHELGHAFVATHYKCQVPVMGIAFMVMFPMLYSDISDAWRLKRRRHRLMIDAAGMMTEIALGGLCMFLWALSPDGPFRTLCFFVATTGWAMSVLVNLSPFMRFDGYHILADGLGVHNLQSRGFALGKWQLRKLLFALPDEVPEQFSPRLHRILVAYAWGTWIYRFFLFLGIALLVYYMFFKLLGIFLLGVELVWFIGIPIYNELKEWWGRRSDIVNQWRALVTLSVFGVAFVALFLPLDDDVNMPALLVAAKESQHYAPGVSQIAEVLVRPGSVVKSGDALIRLYSSANKDEQSLVRLRLSLVEKRLARSGVDLEEKALRPVLKRERSALIGEIGGLQKLEEKLTLRAEFDGTVTDVLFGLRKGLWINQEQRLVHMVRKSDGYDAHGLVSEQDVERLKNGNTGVFISEVAGPVKVQVVLQNIGLGKGAGHELKYLSSVNNGAVLVDQSSDGTARPSNAVYPVLFKATTGKFTEWMHEQRGTVVVQADAQSIMGRFFRHGVSVILREIGF